MCLDCNLEDPSLKLIEEKRQQQQQKEKEEEEKRQQEELKNKMILKDPKVLAIYQLTRELTNLRESKAPVPIGVGNLCNREVYEYSLKNSEKCPKCQTKVKIEYETLELNYYYDLRLGIKYSNRPGYMCDQVCFYNLDNNDIYITGLAKTCQKKDENGYYLAINGKKYPLPENKSWNDMISDVTGFNSYLNREIMYNYDDYAFLVGSGVTDFFFGERKVHVYVCSNCGYQYHLISLPCFIHRDKNKDGIVEENNEEGKA